MRQETGGRPNDLLTPEALYRLGRRVEHELSGCLRDFRLSRQGDGLVLRGRARTYHARQLAQDAVMRATGLVVLRNEIEVT